MELLTLCLQNKRNMERAIWVIVRSVLDAGEDPDKVADLLGCSRPTMYRRLREQGLTYGRGGVAR